jgi:aryl-alcohol dehydrogenase-like predicted oxidoreductase
MKRRDILKSAGLALAGTTLLPLSALANTSTADEKEKNTKSKVGKRKLGSSLEVSSIGIGVQNMSRTYQTTIPNRKQMHQIIHAAYDNGVTFFDAAEAYGVHEVERILGEGVQPFRNKINIATKFGWNIDQETEKRLPGLNSKPAHIVKVVDGMLKRLRTDHIDLLYQHRVDPDVPIEDVVGTIKDLIQQGKVLHYGLSEPGVQTVQRAHKEHPITAIQNEYSLLWRGPEKSILPLCKELGIGFVCWSPLGVGFLTGAIDEQTRFAQGDIRGIETRFSRENIKNNLAILKLLNEWSIKKQATPTQISLAWLQAQEPWIVPIPGTTQMEHMLENIGADKVKIKFTAVDLNEFNNRLNAIEVFGERLPPMVQAFSDVEAPMKK